LEGWLFDLYPAPEGGVFAWLITRDGRAIRLYDSWHPSIYAWASSPTELNSLLTQHDLSEVEMAVDYKYVSPGDFDRSKVLRLTFKRGCDIAAFLRNTSPRSLINIRLFNVGIPLAQLYMYEKDLFPLAYVRTYPANRTIKWELLDDANLCRYETPPLRGATLALAVKKTGRIPSFNDPLESIRVKTRGIVTEIEGGSEIDKLLDLVELIQEIDPDVILTENGDSFVFPYLIHRASRNRMLSRMILDREGRPLRSPREGRSYFSYGRIYYKPSPTRLLGRLHLDACNDFIFEDCGLQGLFEIARTCRTPLHRASRETIGTNMTSLQMYQAFRRGILIPWKKNEPENFKSAWELLKADRGGFILEPKIGLFDAVGEIDFASLYPTLMMKHNLTPECISCRCCTDSMKVPELDYGLCEKKVGIVPHTLQILLHKRAQYKSLMNHPANPKTRKIYDQRQGALKWALVCCLPHDTLVPILFDGELRVAKIGEFIDNMVGDVEGVLDCSRDMYVAGLGSDLRVKYSRVRRLIKTRTPERMLDIGMDNGRRICATPNHEFYVLSNGKIRVKVADKLKVGDLIPVSKVLPDPPSTITEINLIQALLSKLEPSEVACWRVKGAAIKLAVWQKRKLLYRMGVPYTNVRYWYQSGIIPLRYLEFLSLPQEQHRQLFIGRGRVKGGTITWLPSNISVSHDFGFFLGLFVADGSTSRSFLRFDIGQDEPELLSHLRKITRKLFHLRLHISKERRARIYVAQINCIGLVRVLEKVFGVGGSANRGNLCVPMCILNARFDAILGFISGLIAGDGSVSKTRNFISISTSSENLLNQLSYLLLRIGFQHSLQKSYRKPFDLYRLDIVDPLAFTKLRELSFLKKLHRQRLAVMASRLCTSDRHHIPYEMIPVLQSKTRLLARRLRTVRDHRVDARVGRVCPRRALRMLRKLGSRSAHQRYLEAYGSLERVVSGDVGFVSIREIKETHPSSDFVYCFELAGDLPGFFAGNGAVFTHNSFGYLGYKNARFGKIDAHISVCAFARHVLRETIKITQRNGFSVVHGIVDSVWLKKNGASEADYVDLCETVEKELGLPISFEGIYRWIVFLPSKVHTQLPVLNRYYGVFKHGEIKMRGIEYRRRDTPEVIKQCQRDMINYLATAHDRTQFLARLPGVLQLIRSYLDKLENRRVDLRDLLITKQLSKNPTEYRSNVAQAVAARQLVHEGRLISAGQNVSYVLQKQYGWSESKVAPSELLDASIQYDAQKYTQLLLDSAVSLLSPLGYDKQTLLKELRS